MTGMEKIPEEKFMNRKQENYFNRLCFCMSMV